MTVAEVDEVAELLVDAALTPAKRPGRSRRVQVQRVGADGQTAGASHIHLADGAWRLLHQSAYARTPFRRQETNGSLGRSRRKEVGHRLAKWPGPGQDTPAGMAGIWPALYDPVLSVLSGIHVSEQG